MLRLRMWSSGWTTCVRCTRPWVQSLALKNKCWRMSLAKLMACFLSGTRNTGTAGFIEETLGSQQVCSLLRDQDWEKFSKHSLSSLFPASTSQFSTWEQRQADLGESQINWSYKIPGLPGLTADTLSKAKQSNSHSFPTTHCVTAEAMCLKRHCL